MNFGQPFIHCGVCFKQSCKQTHLKRGSNASLQRNDEGDDDDGGFYMTSCAHVLCYAHTNLSNQGQFFGNQIDINNIKITCGICQTSGVSLKKIDDNLPMEIAMYFNSLPQQLETIFAISQFQYVGMQDMVNYQRSYIQKLLEKVEKQRQLLITAKEEITQIEKYKSKIKDLEKNNSILRAKVRSLENGDSLKAPPTRSIHFMNRPINTGNSSIIEHDLKQLVEQQKYDKTNDTPNYNTRQQFNGEDGNTFIRMVKESSTKRGMFARQSMSTWQQQHQNLQPNGLLSQPRVHNQVAESTNIQNNSGINYGVVSGNMVRNGGDVNRNGSGEGLLAVNNTVFGNNGSSRFISLESEGHELGEINNNKISNNYKRPIIFPDLVKFRADNSGSGGDFEVQVRESRNSMQPYQLKNSNGTNSENSGTSPLRPFSRSRLSTSNGKSVGHIASRLSAHMKVGKQRMSTYNGSSSNNREIGRVLRNNRI